MEYHIAPCVGNIHLIPTYLCEIAQDSFLVCVFSAKAKRNMGELAQSTHTTLSKRFYSVQTLYQILSCEQNSAPGALLEFAQVELLIFLGIQYTTCLLLQCFWFR